MSESDEAARQQLLLDTIRHTGAPGALQVSLREVAHSRRGLQAYQANAGALAERALAAAYPVVAQLLGAESFAHLARVLWQQQPPTRGDISDWGSGLPDFMAHADALAGEPYLPDVARLEWAVHQAAGAADAVALPGAFARLADTDPATLWLRVRPGTAVLSSAYPVLSIWQAHQPAAARTVEHLSAAASALRSGKSERALVWRQGWRVQVTGLDEADAAFTLVLLRGHNLGEALLSLSDRPGFDFESWLLATLPRGWLLGAAVTQQCIAAPGL